MRPFLLFPMIAALLLGACATTKAPKSPQGIAVGEPHPQAPIQPAKLAEHVQVLASDEFEGREPSTPGEQKTLDYIIAQYKAAGLEPAGENGGWLQAVPLVEASVKGAPALSVKGRDGTKTYSYGDQAVIWTKRIEKTVSLKNAPLVFVGYGVNAPEKNWNDYAGADLKGKVAVILVNDPDFEGAPHNLFGGKAMTWYGRWPYKYEEAARQGAAGALIIHETAPAAYPWAVVQSSWTGPQFDTVRAEKGASRVGVEGWLSNAAALDLFKRAGLDFAKLKAAAQQPGFKAAPMNLTLSTTLETAHRTTVTHNALGVARGARAPDEVIIYGAHHDHLGRCGPVDGDDICNGAQDNALGVAGLIEIARRGQGSGPAQRSVAFIAFGAEEQGLLGSAHYAAHPIFPPAKTVAMINMDAPQTAGRSRNVVVVGHGQSELEDLLREKAAGQDRVVTPEENPENGGFYRSDHFSFAKIGIPALYAEGGLDLREGGVAAGEAWSADYGTNRYHKPADEYSPDWDLSGAAEDFELLHQVGRALADSGAWPNWKPGSEFRPIRDKSRPAAD
jgi:Zn-dependent M28 family amino/carboxypeptidase